MIDIEAGDPISDITAMFDCARKYQSNYRTMIISRKQIDLVIKSAGLNTAQELELEFDRRFPDLAPIKFNVYD